jgi:hypothetical protein
MLQMAQAQRIFRVVERIKSLTKKTSLSDGRYTVTFRITPVGSASLLYRHSMPPPRE